jgi:diaminopimelate epimerase
MHVTVTKHHGLGNDFLVLDTAQVEGSPDWPEVARSWCDRRRGLGADGLLLLARNGDRQVSMLLHNADGSPAEMSGNGIRCLVHAADLAAGSPGGVYIVDTAAGERRVEVLDSVDEVTTMLSVDMGAVGEIAAPTGWDRVGCHPDRPVSHLSLGNPHAVVGVDDVGDVDLGALGALVPEVNLEVIAPGPEPHAITMRVHERGVGITEACGTGACASALAAVSWGLVASAEPEVLVHMDGGDARVRVDLPNRTVTLVGPATFVASMSVML